MEITRTVKQDPLTQTVKDRLQDLTDRLGGTIQYSDWRNSKGESGKRIMILYNHADTD